MRRCNKCRKEILPYQKAVRILIEVAQKGDFPGEDPKDWDDVEDWEIIGCYHIECAMQLKGESILIDDCRGLLGEDHISDNERPTLKLV